MDKQILERPIRAGVFVATDQAEEAVRRLLGAGFSKDQVTVICSDRVTEARFREFEHQEPAGYYMRTALFAGAGIGAAIGLVAFLLIKLGTGVEDTLTLGALSTLTGTVIGGFVGAMMTQGVEKELSNFYDQEVTPGDILVAAEDHGEGAKKHLVEAEHILAAAGARPMELTEG